MNQRVRSPRRTSALSYSGQFEPRYLVLYVGWTFERLDIRNSQRGEETCTPFGPRRGVRAPTPCDVPVRSGNSQHREIRDTRGFQPCFKSLPGDRTSRRRVAGPTPLPEPSPDASQRQSRYASPRSGSRFGDIPRTHETERRPAHASPSTPDRRSVPRSNRRRPRPSSV